MKTFHIIWTIVLLAIFVGIVWWAYSGKRKKRFERAARIPLEDDNPKQAGNHESSRGNDNG